MERKRLKVWLAMPLCHFQILWRERNCRTFEDKENHVHRIKLKFLYNLWTWSFNLMCQGPPSIVDFVDWVGLS